MRKLSRKVLEGYIHEPHGSPWQVYPVSFRGRFSLHESRSSSHNTLAFNVRPILEDIELFREFRNLRNPDYLSRLKQACRKLGKMEFYRLVKSLDTEARKNIKEALNENPELVIET